MYVSSLSAQCPHLDAAPRTTVGSSCRTQVAPQPQAMQNHTLGLPMQLQKGGLWERTLAGVCESPRILDFSIPCRFGQRIWIRHD